MSHVKWSRAVLAGLSANLASFLVGGGGYLLFGWVFKLEPVFIWRWTPEKFAEMSVGWWVYLIVGNTLLAVVLALAYAVLYYGIPGQGIRKGFAFGLIVWLIGVVPATWTLNVLTVVNGWAILYFTTQAIVEYQVYGAIIAVVYGEPLRGPTEPVAAGDPRKVRVPMSKTLAV
jgi:hypothetical protein